MIGRWLNHILHLSSYIYKKKDELLTLPTFKCFVNAIMIIFLDLYLSLISLPVFFFIPAKHIKKEAKAYKFSFSTILMYIGITLLIISFHNISTFFPSVIFTLIIIEIILFLLFAIYGKVWMHLTVRISSYLFSQKQKLIASTNKIIDIARSFYIIILEVVLLTISLPVYIFIKPQTVKEIKGSNFRMRRKMSLIYIGFFLLLILLQILIALILVSNFYSTTISIN